MSKINTVLLISQYHNTLSYYDDWMDAFKNNEKLNLCIIDANNRDAKSLEVYKKIEDAEFIIVHHSILADTLQFIIPFKKAIINRKGLLLTFIGNEVNLPKIQMKDKIQILKEIAPEFIATQLLLEAGQWLYNECTSSKVISMPHALNPTIFRAIDEYSPRNIEIGSRSALYGAYIGDDDRNSIIRYFKARSQKYNLKFDVEWASQYRFNRKDWALFLNRCKATVSTEAGSFYLEKNDILINEIMNDLRKKGNFLELPSETSWATKFYRKIMPKTLRKLIRNKISGIVLDDDCLGNSDYFTEIWLKYFKNRPKAPSYTKCISSRHFEAVGTKTVQIMFPGRYNDILKPGDHFIELRKDFSNIDEVLSILSNNQKLNKIVNEVNNFVHHAHTHQHRVSEMMNIVFN